MSGVSDICFIGGIWASKHISNRRLQDKGRGVQVVLLDHRSPFDYSIFKIPQNWLHKGLFKVSWVRLSFSPPCLPCSHGGKTYCGIKRECIDFAVCISLAAFQVDPDSIMDEREKDRGRSNCLPLQQCVLGVIHT